MILESEEMSVNIIDSCKYELYLCKGFQHVATHGEVCPAGWSKGAPSMKPKL